MAQSLEDAQAAAQDEQADRELGTVLKLLYVRGHHGAVQQLIGATSVRWDYVNRDWGITYYEVVMVVEVERFPEYQDAEASSQISAAFDEVWRGTQREVESVSVQPALVAAGWRNDVNGLLRPNGSNQAALVPLQPNALRDDSMSFRDRAELMLYNAFKARQSVLPRETTLTIVPNPAVRVPGKTWEPDFLIAYGGRAGIVEVDGTSHNKRYANDKSRDEILEDSGFALVMRLDVKDAEDPRQVEAFVDRFLRRLAQQAV